MSELAKITEWGLAQLEDVLTPEEMAEEISGLRIEFPRIKIPSGGGISFELPNPNDPNSPEPAKTIQAVLIHHHPSNAYWQSSDTNNAPPDCAAPRGDIGVGNPGGECKSCPLNAFGSGEGGQGKACKNTHRLYLLTPGNTIPWMLSLPATSIKPFSNFLQLAFLGKGKRSSSGVIEIGLIKKTNNSGQDFSVATFKFIGPLEDALAAQMLTRSVSVKAMAAQEKAVVALDDDEEGVPF